MNTVQKNLTRNLKVLNLYLQKEDIRNPLVVAMCCGAIFPFRVNIFVSNLGTFLITIVDTFAKTPKKMKMLNTK